MLEYNCFIILKHTVKQLFNIFYCKQGKAENG